MAHKIRGIEYEIFVDIIDEWQYRFISDKSLLSIYNHSSYVSLRFEDYVNNFIDKLMHDSDIRNVVLIGYEAG